MAEVTYGSDKAPQLGTETLIGGQVLTSNFDNAGKNVVTTSAAATASAEVLQTGAALTTNFDNAGKNVFTASASSSPVGTETFGVGNKPDTTNFDNTGKNVFSWTGTNRSPVTLEAESETFTTPVDYQK
jgi:hypothetical protein